MMKRFKINYQSNHLISLSKYPSILFFYIPTLCFAQISEKYKRFYHALDANGLEKFHNELSKPGIPWPRITTDSRATNEKIPIDEQKEVVALGEHLLKKLIAESRVKPLDQKEEVEKDAQLYFSLGEKIWQRGGYRNQTLGLACVEMGVQRCGQLSLLTKGLNTGPKLPESFSEHTISKYIELYVSLIPESRYHSAANLAEKIRTKPPKGTFWIAVGVEIARLTSGGTTDENYKFKEKNIDANLLFEYIDVVFNKEMIGAFVTRYAQQRGRREGNIESLACYLRKGGSLKELLEKQAFIEPFRSVMKNDQFQYTFMPLMMGEPGPGHAAAEAEIAQDQMKFSERIFESSYKIKMTKE